MRNIKKYKSILILSLIFLYLSFFTYADEIASISTVSDTLQLNNVDLDNLIEQIKSEYETGKCYLPTKFSQPTNCIGENAFFGLKNDDKPIYSVFAPSEDEKRYHKIALTFDSAYINEYTYQILDILDNYNIKATFFMTYEFMSKNQNQVLEIIKRGHEVGNHSVTHPHFSEISDEDKIREVLKCHYFIRDLCGVDMTLFRFPFGEYDKRSIEVIKKLGYFPIQWAYDSVDWKNISVTAIINRFLDPSKIYGGMIILFHNGAKYTSEALPIIIEYMREIGYDFARVSDIIYTDNFICDKSGKQRIYEK